MQMMMQVYDAFDVTIACPRPTTEAAGTTTKITTVKKGKQTIQLLFMGRRLHNGDRRVWVRESCHPVTVSQSLLAKG